eukprot:TRINITY_DN80514_c0_g1_i1.p1 TRINITY_DN80514_c0_g1~~TRINITY_DN80514_c0_g1_i1.p1  ORF type:complete len:541 (+),score=98.48 TRINITY_DN80514_c0_g1_i1:94-1716(+)
MYDSLVRSNAHALDTQGASFSATWLLPHAAALLACSQALLWLLCAAIAKNLSLRYYIAVFTCAAASAVGAVLCSGEQHFLDVHCPALWQSRLAALNACVGCIGLLQAALIVLGPEDQKLGSALAAIGDDSTTAQPAGVQAHRVALLARSLPILALVVSTLSAQDAAPLALWTRCLEVVHACVALSFIVFWMVPTSGVVASSRRRVLFSRYLWRRIGIQWALPALAGGLLASQIYQAGVTEGCLGGAFGLVAAAVSFAAMAYHQQYPFPFESSELRNLETVKGYLLFGWPVVQACQLVGALVSDDYVHKSFRWPTLSMTATSAPGAFAILMTSPALSLAVLLAFQVIEDTAVAPSSDTLCEKTPLLQGRPDDLPKSVAVAPKEVPGDEQTQQERLRRMGCQLGQLSVALGAMSAAAVEGSRVMDIVHSTLSIAFFASLLGAILITTLGSPRGGGSGRSREVLTAVICVDILALFVNFLLVNKYVPNDFHIRHAYYATSEYMGIAMLALWPLTWRADVAASESSSLQKETAPLAKEAPPLKT